MSIRNPLDLSDEEIMNMNSPEELVEKEEADDVPAQDPVEEDEPAPEAGSDFDKFMEDEFGGEPDVEDEDDEPTPEAKVDEEEEPTTDDNDPENAEKVDQDTGKVDKESATIDDKKDGEVDPEPTPAKQDGEQDQEAPDLKAFFDILTGPIQASGKTVQFKDPEELKALIQQGVHFTKNMQQIAPYRKTVMSLQNNGLMEGDRLNHMIDVSKGDKGAILRLLKEHNIDPMDLDPNAAATYQTGNHEVTDSAVQFRTILDDLQTSDTGMATIRTVNSWDDASKDVLGNHPAILQDIHHQRETGVYDVITNEVERLQVLGKIAPGTPFFTAYKHVGDQLHASGALDHLLRKPAVQQPVAQPAPAQAPVPAPQPAAPVARTTQVPKPRVSQNDKAKATQPARSGKPVSSSNAPNFLSMSDEEFEKVFDKFQGRL